MDWRYFKQSSLSILLQWKNLPTALIGKQYSSFTHFMKFQSKIDYFIGIAPFIVVPGD